MLELWRTMLERPVALRDQVAWAAMPFHLVVAHRDRVVVETHQPARPGLPIGEKRVAGDRPVIAYRRRRREVLIEAARRKGSQSTPSAWPFCATLGRRVGSAGGRSSG